MWGSEEVGVDDRDGDESGDGAPNAGASGYAGHLDMILGANTRGAIVHTFGIAATGSFESFLRSIARETGGSYYSVP